MDSRLKHRLPSVVILSFFIAGPLLVGFPARAETLLVCPQGCPFSSIQAALDRANPGDTILIQAGTYVGNLVILKPGLILRGEDPTRVILQARQTDQPVISLRAPDTRLNNLTLTGGARGIHIEFVQSGEVHNCLIRGNATGVFIGLRASLRLIANQIRENGNGVETLNFGRVEMQENVITNNRGCGLKADDRSELLGSDNAIFANGENLCGSAQNRTALLDQTPPPPPQNLTVAPAEWTNQGRFEIAWDDPRDVAGIAAYFFKLGSAPTSPTDGTRRDIAQKPLIVENPPEGEQPVFVWLEDGMGNKTHVNAARGTLRFDRAPPSGTLLINQGARQTMELRVTLTLQVQDAASGLAEMRFSNDGQTWSPWEPFATEKADWDLSQFGGSADPGGKTVSAQVRDRAGNIGQFSARIEYVRPPVAQFAITPQKPRPAQRVTFDASASSSPNGAITRYAWNFGDGAEQETNQPIVQHVYASEGRYTIRLTVTDALGITASAERELVVEARSDTLRVPQDFSTVEEAVRAAQPGDVILISVGIYIVNLVVDKPVTLRGAGPQTLLRGQDPNRPVFLVQSEGSQVRMEALRLTTRSNATAAAVFVQSGRLTIAAASLEGQGSVPALELAGPAQVTLEGTEMAPIRLSSSGTVLRARDQAQLIATHAEFLGGLGLEFTGSATAVVRNSRIATSGIGLGFSGSGNLTLHNVTLETGNAGLSFSGSGSLTLTDMSIEAGGDGLVFSSSGSLTTDGVQVMAGKTAVRLAGSAELSLDLTDSELAGAEVGLSLRETVRVTAMNGEILGGGIGLDVGENAQLVIEGAEVTSDGLNVKVSGRARAWLQRTKISGGLVGVLVRDSATLILDGNTITDHALWGTFLPHPPCLPTGTPTSTLTGHTDSVRSVAFSPDGKLLASGSYQEIKLWEVGTGNLLRTLTGHTSWVYSVAFSPDGKLLASGSGDRTIKLWEVETGNLLRTLTGHTSWVYSVAFSPDGKVLASGSDDRTIKLWEVGTGNLLRTLTGHTSWVYSVAFSPDGKLLASGSGDRTIKLWGVVFELLSEPVGEFTGVIAGSENVMERNGQRLPERALQAGQADVCPAELLFLVKPK